MAKQPKILAFAGSLREKSYTKRIVKVAVEGVRKAGAEVKLKKMQNSKCKVQNLIQNIYINPA